MLKNVLNLDIFDLNFAYDERIACLSRLPATLPKPGVLVRVVAFVWHLLEGILHLNIPFVTPRIPKRSILFFVYTKNQRDALKPLAEETQNSYFVGYNVPVDRHFPVFWSHIIALPFFPLVLLKLLKAHGYRRKTFRYNLDQYWLTYGYYVVSHLWLAQIAPNALVVSNDHNMPQRVMVKVARELYIPTIYLQHASVTERFPPLSFDYALLEGKDALQKYDQAGASQTTVFLVGMPKMDRYFKHVNLGSKVQSVGICTNLQDPLPRVDALCEYIHNNFPDLPIVIRPHPRDKRYADWEKLVQSHHASLSDSHTELSFEFLRCVDVVFVGDSSILLEAALMNVYPIYYDFSQQIPDYYGFVRNGLADYISEPQQAGSKLRLLLESKPDVQMKAKMYCAIVGTKYVGESAKLASVLIQRVASRSRLDLDRWIQSCSFNLKAYELLD
jgi:hypothetical protein